MSELLYIMSPGCGWCTKADPVVDELKKAGFDITTLNVSNPDDAKRAKELKDKYDAQCGTPQFIDADTGNTICGFREKGVLEKWASGEKIPPPAPRPQPKPQQQPQQPQQPVQQMQAPVNPFARAELKLQVWQEAKQVLVDKFYNEFEIWSNWQFNENITGDCPITKRPTFPTSKNIKTEAEKVLEFIQ